LRAVAKAIEQLEKQRVPVPDSLRRTKMHLVTEIGQHAQCNRQLMTLGEGLSEILAIIEGATGKPRSEGKSSKEATPRQRRSRNSDQPITHQSVLRGYSAHLRVVECPNIYLYTGCGILRYQPAFPKLKTLLLRKLKKQRLTCAKL